MSAPNLTDLALRLLETAAAMAPPIEAWLRSVSAGRADPISRRVAAILPAVSKSEQALDEIRRPKP